MRNFKYILPLLFVSCQYFPWLNKEEGDKLLAEVYDQKLYLSQITNNDLKFKSKEDSIVFIQSYVRNWVEKNVITQKAQLNIPQEEQEELEKKVAEYKNSLLLFLYEKELVRQNLDTNISQSEIEKYYQANKENFRLEDNIIRCLFIKLNRKSTLLKDFLAKYKLKTADDSLFIISAAKMESEKYFIDFEKWRKLDELVFELPIKEKLLNPKIFLQGNKIIEIEEGKYVYLINILSYRFANDTAPLSYVQEDIKLILINQRKTELINRIRKNIIAQASKTKDVKIYE